jgi:hypothetical protein
MFMTRDGMYEMEAESVMDENQPADDVIDSTMFVNMKSKKVKVKKFEEEPKLEFADGGLLRNYLNQIISAS